MRTGTTVLSHGAFAFVTKPTTTEGLDAAIARESRNIPLPRRKRLLVVEDEPAQQLSIRALLGYDDIDVTVVSTGHEAIASGQARGSLTAWSSIFVFPDMTGFEVLEQLETDQSWKRAARRGLYREGTVAGRRCAAAYAGTQRDR